MIERYRRKEVFDLWSERNKWDVYLKIEILSCEAWAKKGVIPKKDVELIRKHATFSIEKIKEFEKMTKHDIVAFTRCVSESLGEERKWVHYGLTSTDIVDTANGYILKQVNDIIKKDLKTLADVLCQKAKVYKDVPCIGRTHGIHADITSFGLKWALWYDELQRNIHRFNIASAGVEVGKLSGAVGNFANNETYVEEYVCKRLGINPVNIATQVVQRDVYANYFSTIALIGSFLEKMATEVRHWQRTEVHEAEEFFDKGQKGSSAMPHKRNPISSENICGCARVLRGYMSAAYENIALWHERDISHSSTERIMLPDATMLLDYMLNRYTKVLDNLIIYPKQMLKNIYLTHGVIFAQRVMNALITKGLTREQAYDVVQPLAMQAYNNEQDFQTILLANHTITQSLKNNEIKNCFTLDYYFKKIKYIFKKVGIK